MQLTLTVMQVELEDSKPNLERNSEIKATAGLSAVLPGGSDGGPF